MAHETGPSGGSGSYLAEVVHTLFFVPIGHIIGEKLFAGMLSAGGSGGAASGGGGGSGHGGH